MAVRVNLPRQFSAASLFSQVAGSFGQFEQVPSNVDFSFSQLQFVKPSGVVFLSNLSHFLHQNGCEVNYVDINRSHQTIKFLDDSLFFKQHTGAKLRRESSPRDTTLPLLRVRHQDSHSWTRNTFVPWFCQCSGLATEDLAELATCLSEIFNNIDDHTEFDVGSVFCQWYPQQERLIVAVADFGVGIPNTVRRVCPDLSDNESIIRAFEQEFSSRSTPRNRGEGLFYLYQNVVENLNGKLEVHSANGGVVFEKVGNSLRTMPYMHNGYCPGTLIVLEIGTSRIERAAAQVEEFEW